MEQFNDEIWKPIKGYEGLYEISNYGRVKSLNYNRTGKQKIMKSVEDKEGYLTIVLSKNGKVTGFKIHRLVYENFAGPIPKDMQINHIDENKTNNNISNIEICTPKYNANYGTRNERCSEKTRNNKKTSKQIMCVETGIIYPSIGEMARHFGICRTVKRSIENGWKISGYHWKYVN